MAGSDETPLRVGLDAARAPGAGPATADAAERTGVVRANAHATADAAERARAAERGAPGAAAGAPGFPRPLDLLVAAYALLSALVAALGAARGVPGCAPQIAVSLAVGAATLLLGFLARRATNRLVLLLRIAFPAIMYYVFYRQIEILWPVFHGAALDSLVAGVEQSIFGCQPSLAFRAAAPWPWLSEIFCFAYFAYYFYFVAFVVAFLRRGYDEAERIVFAVSLCFYCCYAVFWLFPVVGPHYYFPPALGPRLYDGYVFNHLLFFLTGSGEIHAAAFPSSHVAVAALYTYYARRGARPLFPAMCVVTGLMLFAVVYLKAHYLVDVPAGLAVGALFAWGADRAHDRARRALRMPPLPR